MINSYITHTPNSFTLLEKTPRQNEGRI